MSAKRTTQERQQAYQSGLAGEAQAAAYLQQNGFELLQQRYKTRYGEIDLIVRNTQQQRLHFVEVKTRPNLESGLYALTPHQQQRIWQAAECFIAEHPQHAMQYRQIDLIVIADCQCHYLPNIVQGD